MELVEYLDSNEALEVGDRRLDVVDDDALVDCAVYRVLVSFFGSL